MRTIQKLMNFSERLAMRIDRCLIDANWGHSTDVVYQFCRQSSQSTILTPSHGRFVGASSLPFSDYKRKAGDRVGLNWRIPTHYYGALSERMLTNGIFARMLIVESGRRSVGQEPGIIDPPAHLIQISGRSSCVPVPLRPAL